MKNKLLYDAIGRFYRRTLIFGPTPEEPAQASQGALPALDQAPPGGPPAPDLGARHPGGRP